MLENWSPLRILATVLAAWGLAFASIFMVIYWVLFG